MFIIFWENFITHFGFSQQTLQEEDATGALIVVQAFPGAQSMLQSAAMSTGDAPTMSRLIVSAISVTFQAAIIKVRNSYQSISIMTFLFNTG